MSKRRLSIIPAKAVTDRRLNETCLRVLGQIGTYTDNEGWCYPRQGEIGKALGIGRPAVNRAVAKLAELGYLEVHPQRRKDGGKAANLYRVILDPPVEPVPSEEDEKDPHVSAEAHGACASSDTSPCIGSDTSPCASSDTGHESAASTGHVSPGDTSITSHLNESEIPEDARAYSDTSPPRAFDPSRMALARLKAEIGKAAFSSWFKQTVIDLPEGRDKAALIRAPSPFVANYIRQHFSEKLEDLLGRRIEVVAHGVRPLKAGRQGA
ncbi:DnaA N-terminal domain-containing protein [Parvibaculum sp.]|uniref:helix-turn-helix domain-containing protein n=1 Tax=Parvibaculum sp. TaxID=2024848 RepID=UPI003919A741